MTDIERSPLSKAWDKMYEAAQTGDESKILRAANEWAKANYEAGREEGYSQGRQEAAHG